MITHSDLYSGSLGKLRNAGGSSAFTIPHTVSVKPDYLIDGNYTLQGEFLACSLDGRLFLYRNGNNLNIIALKWNTSSERLRFAATQSFNNNNDIPLARGFDWVLTNNHIFMVSDDAPYILMSNLFDADNSETSLYLILRDIDTGGSGVDPFTRQSWGMRDDNGNSEGTGFFSKDTHLLYPAGTHTFEQCYSVLPAIGDWQIIENFLVRRPSTPLSKSYNHMLSLKPLIPLEFSYLRGTYYGTGYNFDHRGIQLAYFNEQLWGRGIFNIGRIYILPAVFDENNDPVEFYLYISPAYPCSPFLDVSLYPSREFKTSDANDNWLNIGLAYMRTQGLFDDTYLYGFLSEHVGALHGGSCLTASEAKILSVKNNEWLTLAEDEGKVFIDTTNYRSLVIHKNGAGFVQNDPSDIREYQCNTLNQWLAPAGRVEAITTDYTIASADKIALHIALNTEFNRQFINSCILPLSGTTFAGKENTYYKVAVSEHETSDNRKVFGINQIKATQYVPQAINWQDIYRKCINIKFINSFEAPNNFFDTIKGQGYIDITGENQYGKTGILGSFGWEDTPRYFQYVGTYPLIQFNERSIYIGYDDDDNDIFIDEETYGGLDDFGRYSFHRYSSSCEFLSIDINTGTSSVFSISYTLSDDINGGDRSIKFCYTDDSIGAYVGHLVDPDFFFHTVKAFKKLMDVPAQHIGKGNQWFFYAGRDKNWPAPSVCLNNCFEDKVDDRYSYASFREQTTNTIFALRFPADMRNTSYVLNYPDNGAYFFDHNGNKRSYKNYHVAMFHDAETGKTNFSVFHSQINPDVFNFQQEFERSSNVS